MSGYIGPSPVPQSIQRRQTFTATAAQTTFGTTGYTDGDFIDVYLNGVKLVGGTDYTATNGTDVVLTTGAAAGDILDFVTFNSFQLNAPSFDNSLTLQNATEEDTDGGRESTIIFKGEQSGGEISTLAEIEASHDGTADDEKGDLIFRTNDGADGSAPTERLRIDSAGKVGIGTGSPLGKVTIANPFSSAPTSVTASNAYLQLGSTDFGLSNDGKFMIGFGYTDGTNTNSPAYIGFEETSASGDTKGALTFYTRDVVTDTAPTERMRILPSGGLTFNGDTAAANALNDYEQGTWTPAIGAGVTVTSGTFAADAYYTKIGNIVHAFMRQTGGTVNLSAGGHFTGLPFTPAQSLSYAGTFTDSGPSLIGVTLPWAGSQLYWRLTASATSITSLIAYATYRT